MTRAWYLRSMADRDTHQGVLRVDGFVVARCGVTFEPFLLPGGLRGSPQDPDQICPTCNKVRPS